ncbi:MAG: EamA family transporter [Bryobacteraceae bacterium]
MKWPVFAVLSAVFAALTAIFAKIGVAGIDSNVAVAIRTTVVVVFAWGLVSVQGTGASVADIPGRTWTFLVLSGIATGLSWLCYFRALQLGPASRVAPLDKLSVPIAIFLAVVLLGERPTAGVVIGGTLILAGAVIAVAV